jgi:hypothetical protein
MQIEIYLNGNLVGRGNVDAVDTLMGVAMGPFEREPSYDREAHAAEIDGSDNPTGANLPFVVQSSEHGLIECEAAVIYDSADTSNARLVSLLGVAYPSYEKLFGECLAYKEYWQDRVEEPQVDTLYMFVGGGDAMAYTLEESGANLPKQYAPWRFRSEVSTSGPTFKAGADKAALEEVRAKGFAVSVFSFTIGEDTAP